MIPWYFVILILISIVTALIAIFGNISKNSAGFLGIVSGLIIGSLFIGHFMVRSTAGKPISEFHNDDRYKVVSFSTIADDPFRAIVGLRKVADGRSGWLMEKYNDLDLRMYNINTDTALAKLLNSKQPQLPIYIKIKLISENPSPVFTIQD